MTCERAADGVCAMSGSYCEDNNGVDEMITHEELKKLAALAKLSLDGEDMDRLAKDITSILGFAETVSQAAVGLPEDDASGDDCDWDFREDILQPSFPVDEILAHAGERQDGLFVARKKGGQTE
ncbi:MAG: hypothetical protein GX847_10835 [Clostridiales bacterium]|nr:hypothetical protein [Clostridiales bacterium]